MRCLPVPFSPRGKPAVRLVIGVVQTTFMPHLSQDQLLSASRLLPFWTVTLATRAPATGGPSVRRFSKCTPSHNEMYLLLSQPVFKRLTTGYAYTSTHSIHQMATVSNLDSNLIIYLYLTRDTARVIPSGCQWWKCTMKAWVGLLEVGR